MPPVNIAANTTVLILLAATSVAALKATREKEAIYAQVNKILHISR